MREIKFRAWLEGDVGMVYKVGTMKCPLAILDWLTHHHDPEYGLTLMQYTGLKDKNGVEIYEGDILQTQAGLKEVQFGKHILSCCGCCYYGHQSVGFYTAWKKQMPGADEDEWEAENLEVIGNIHENADLLERKGGE